MIGNHPSFSEYLSRHLPFKVQKIMIDGGFSCPNRDGTISTGGCSFCNNESFNPQYCRDAKTIREQIDAGKKFFALRDKPNKYLAYFQAYSGTYATIDVLRQRYSEALQDSDVVGLIIGTRPDCMTQEVLQLLTELKKKTFVLVEFGVETLKDATLEKINRGHSAQCSRDAILRASEAGLQVGAHIIFGLPGETSDEMISSADSISQLPINVLKIHQLQIVKGSLLGNEYIRDSTTFNYLLTAEDYADIVARFVKRLRPDIALERFVSECPNQLLLAPRWGKKPSYVQQMIEKRIVELE